MAVRKIIHISDLHFSETQGEYSLLQNKDYVEEWMEQINNIEGLDTVIISGDIVDKGGSERIYHEAESFIKVLREKVKIQHILCVPGNHDVSRDLLKAISGKDDINPERLWEKYEVKLEYYWKFLENCGLRRFKQSGIVSYEILQNPDIVLLGLDSTDRIGVEDNCGFINIESMRQTLKEIFGEDGQKYNEYVKVAVLHHRPIVYESASQVVTENNGMGIGQYGTCDSENWRKVRKLLLEYNVHYVLTGHVHGSQSSQIRPFDSDNDGIYYSTVGSIGVDFNNELKELINKEGNREQYKELLKKMEKLQCYVSLNGNHNSYNIWSFDSSGLIREEQYKFVVDEGKRVWHSWSKKDFGQIDFEQEDEGGIFDEEIVSSLYIQEEKEDYGEKILECVRDQGLYKTGHYHWKNTARLNWIDTSYFFHHREQMLYIARGIDELFSKERVLREADCMIGLGIKGSLLLSYVRFLFPEMKCSYLPESEHEYNNYEMALFDEFEKVKSVVVLTDVVHTGNTIKTFSENIYKRQKKFIKVYVIAIFDATQNGKIADVQDKAQFKLFSLARLKVADCPLGDGNCDIYVKKLASVIEYKED